MRARRPAAVATGAGRLGRVFRLNGRDGGQAPNPFHEFVSVYSGQVQARSPLSVRVSCPRVSEDSVVVHIVLGLRILEDGKQASINRESVTGREEEVLEEHANVPWESLLRRGTVLEQKLIARPGNARQVPPFHEIHDPIVGVQLALVLVADQSPSFHDRTDMQGREFVFAHMFIP